MEVAEEAWWEKEARGHTKAGRQHEEEEEEEKGDEGGEKGK